jgi:hypothetical protein
VFQLDNRRTDLDKIWNARYAIEACPKIVLFNFLQLVVTTWQANEVNEAVLTAAPSKDAFVQNSDVR